MDEFYEDELDGLSFGARDEREDWPDNWLGIDKNDCGDRYEYIARVEEEAESIGEKW